MAAFRTTPLGPTLCVLARVTQGNSPLAGGPVLFTYTAAPSPELCFARLGESEGSMGEGAELTGRMLAYERHLALVTVDLDALLTAGEVVAVTMATADATSAEPAPPPAP